MASREELKQHFARPLWSEDCLRPALLKFSPGLLLSLDSLSTPLPFSLHKALEISSQVQFNFFGHCPTNQDF